MMLSRPIVIVPLIIYDKFHFGYASTPPKAYLVNDNN